MHIELTCPFNISRKEIFRRLIKNDILFPKMELIYLINYTFSRLEHKLMVTLFKSIIFQLYSKPDDRKKYHKDKTEPEIFIIADF